MASLKEMRNRIDSVKSTQKITKALNMVAAAKLKRAQDQAESARPYAKKMAAVIANLAAGISGDSAPKLLAGTGRDQKHLVVVATGDKGLAGGFNTNVIRAARERIKTDLRWKLGFLAFAEVHFISARHGTGVGEMMESVLKAYRAAMTPFLAAGETLPQSWPSSAVL